jgi:Zn-dependent peptidase ImmA (M78 family)/transcriptional regulator with XRE-family HTH domain
VPSPIFGNKFRRKHADLPLRHAIPHPRLQDICISVNFSLQECIGVAKNIVRRVDRNLARRLREARREVGLSTRAVTKLLPTKLAVSHTTIAHYENGEAMPSIDVLAALADVYKRTINWFLETRECLTGFRYRNLPSRVSLGDKRQYEALASKWTDAYLNLERHLGQQRRSKTLLGREGLSPQQLAEAVRKNCLDLDDDQPVQNVVSVLESFSAWALEVRAAFELDGAAARHGDAFVVVLNPDVANERLRMNAAHELAYLLYDDCKDALRWNERDVEKRAYSFATSLLLPPTQLREAFEGKSFLKLIEYKERFGVSLVAMIFMAEQADVINTTTSRWLRSEIVRRGWRRQEPGYVWRDRAIRFETMLETAIQTKTISWLEAERITGIREDELRQRLTDIMLQGKPETNGGESIPDTLSLAAFRVAE